MKGSRVISGLLLLLLSFGCGGRMPEDLGPRGEALADCPASPNCVSTAATDEEHAIAPFEILGDGAAAWAGLGELLRETEDVELVADEPRYRHAVYTTRLMRYRDDVEFLLRPETSRIEVRSASRVGYGDMGANRDRIEAIRQTLAERGWVRAAEAD